jgi:branched-chain amino acid transport system permease protein
VATYGDTETGRRGDGTTTSGVAAPPRPRVLVTARWAELSQRRRNTIIFVLFTLFVLVYPVIDRQFNLNRLGSMNPIFIYVMLALGLNIVVGFAGLLDLGYAAFFAIGGYTAAFLTSAQSPLPEQYRTDFWIAMALSWLVAAAFGVILGAPTLRLRGDYLAIVTLAFGEIVPRAILNLDRYTGGSKGLNPIGRPHVGGYELLASDQVQWYYLIVLVGAISVFAITRLHDSRLGRAWMAMREDEVAAASMGIDLVRTKLLAFSLGASFSGFAGSLFASMLQFIDPFQFDFSISIMVLAMIILGGIGNIWGVMVGGVVLGVFNFILTESATGWIRGFGQTLGLPVVSPFLQAVDLSNSKLMIFGLALVLLMLLRPEGLFPSAQRKAEIKGELLPETTVDVGSVEPEQADVSQDERVEVGER